MGSVEEDMYNILIDLSSIGLLEQTSPGYFKLGPLHHELERKYKNKIPFTQEERDKITLIGISIDDLAPTLELCSMMEN